MRSLARGMTLIEVLVALALLTLLSAGLLSGFRLGQRTFEQVTGASAASADLAAVQRFLRTTLESTYPFEGSGASPVERYGLEGDRDTLEFTAPAPQALGSVGHYRYALTLVAASGGTNNLVVRGGIDRDGVFREAVEETLIEDVAAVEWSYRSSSDRTDWLDRWGDQRTLPRLIRLRVIFASGDPRRWPELVIAPRITNDASCEFDVVSQTCRGGST